MPTSDWIEIKTFKSHKKLHKPTSILTELTIPISLENREQKWIDHPTIRSRRNNSWPAMRPLCSENFIGTLWTNEITVRAKMVKKQEFSQLYIIYSMFFGYVITWSDFDEPVVLYKYGITGQIAVDDGRWTGMQVTVKKTDWIHRTTL